MAEELLVGAGMDDQHKRLAVEADQAVALKVCDVGAGEN